MSFELTHYSILSSIARASDNDSDKPEMKRVVGSKITERNGL